VLPVAWVTLLLIAADVDVTRLVVDAWPLLILVAVAATALTITVPAAATVYDAAASFSVSSNPNADFTFGWEPAAANLPFPGAPFTTYPTPFLLGTYNGWEDPSVPGTTFYSVPSVFHNPSASAATVGSITLTGNQLAFHPGQDGELSVIRFTAPQTAVYALSLTASGADFTGPTDTTVYREQDSFLPCSQHRCRFSPGSRSPTTPAFSTAMGETFDVLVGFDLTNKSDVARDYSSTTLRQSMSLPAAVQTNLRLFGSSRFE
jgi:hypothetical protein